IRESNERYELALKATNDVIWDWDIERNKIYRSPNYSKIFGFPLAQDGIYTESWIDSIHVEDRKRVLDHLLLQVNSLSAVTWEDKYRFYRVDGELAYVQDHGYILRDETRKPVRMVGAMW